MATILINFPFLTNQHILWFIPMTAESFWSFSLTT